MAWVMNTPEPYTALVMSRAVGSEPYNGRIGALSIYVSGYDVEMNALEPLKGGSF